MVYCNTAVTPLLTHWSYCNLALSQQYVDIFTGQKFHYLMKIIILTLNLSIKATYSSSLSGPPFDLQTHNKSVATRTRHNIPTEDTILFLIILLPYWPRLYTFPQVTLKYPTAQRPGARKIASWASWFWHYFWFCKVFSAFFFQFLGSVLRNSNFT